MFVRPAAARWALLLIALIGLAARAPSAASADTETHDTIRFTEYADEASLKELARRLMSPLSAARELGSAAAGGAMQMVDLRDERFVVRVPSRAPDHGYGLLVFVPPWQDARIPLGWDRVLDRFGFIFASAARSGNDESAMGRREPLALLATRNLAKQYAIDPARVYIGGFSGGSRVALRLALGYPDLFAGVILNAGSDPIGTRDVPLPPRELLARFQESTRVFVLTGERDVEHANEDLVSERSLRRWCVQNLDSYSEPRIGHQVAGAASLLRAIAGLEQSAVGNASKLAQCRARTDAELTARLADIERLISAGERARAGAELGRLDAMFGGLAAPRSLELDARLHAQPP